VQEEYIQEIQVARHQWLTPIILATQEAENRRIKFEANLGK
jgi:hypothetical protein